MSASGVVLHFTGPPESEVDDLGFENPWQLGRGKELSEKEEEARNEYLAFWKSYLPILIRRRKRWDQMDPRRNTNLLQRFIQKGIPSCMRREIWLRNCPPRPSGRSLVLQHVLDAIQLDLPRTFPDNVHIRSPEARKQLGRVLVCLAEQIPSIGYCQGLNFIAGLCLLVLNDETRAADLLVHLVSPRAEYYTDDMDGLRRDIQVLDEIIRLELPAVHRTLRAVEIGLDILVGKWFLCLFIDSLPMESVLRIWDCLIYEGDAWLFRVTLRLLRGNEKKLSACHRMDELISVVHSIGATRNAMQCHALIKAAKHERITAKQIDQLRLRFATP